MVASAAEELLGFGTDFWPFLDYCCGVRPLHPCSTCERADAQIAPFRCHPCTDSTQNCELSYTPQFFFYFRVRFRKRCLSSGFHRSRKVFFGGCARSHGYFSHRRLKPTPNSRTRRSGNNDKRLLFPRYLQLELSLSLELLRNQST